MTPCVYTQLMPSLICHMNTQVSLTGGIGVILYHYWFFTVSPAWLMKAIKKPIFLMIQTLRVPVGSGFKQQMCLVHLFSLSLSLNIHLLGCQACGSITCQGFNLTRSWTEPLRSLNGRKCNNVSPSSHKKVHFWNLSQKTVTLTWQFYKMGLLITLSTFQE